MSWDQDPQVLSPVGRTIAEQLEQGPPRQAIQGFEPVYRDIVDYIIRCTHRIWEEKDIGLCRTHYTDQTVMHMLTGPACGLDAVTQRPQQPLQRDADRVVVVDDTDEGGGGQVGFLERATAGRVTISAR